MHIHRPATLAILSMLLFVAPCAAATPTTAPTPTNYDDKDGGFSYDLPAGWQLADAPGVKYKVAKGDPQNGFAPNINVVDEQFSGTVPKYASLNERALKRALAECKFLKREDFQTTDGLAGYRVIAEDQQGGKKLRQTFYFFGNGDRKYVVTCSTLADGGDALDAVFEASMKTFHVH